MITLSLCMIVKNEEDVLGRCLESAAQLVDEIIIVDTGSSDLTREIARIHTEHVFDFAWIDDFSAARNFSFSKATMSHILWLDADDVILEKDAERLQALKEELDLKVDTVMMKYTVTEDAEGNPTFSYYRERILRNCPSAYWNGAVHEAITPFGQIFYSDIAVTHRKLKAGDPDRNLHIFEKLIAQGEPLNPRQQYYYARELYYHQRYEEGAALFLSFIDSGLGWVEDNIFACQMLAYCYYAMGKDSLALSSLFRSLEFDIPRPELCCDIGKHYFDRERFELAAFWYERALAFPLRETPGSGFTSPDCHGYIPSLQLCLCYHKLGDPIQAAEYNEKAAEYKPGDPTVLANRTYFSQQLKTS